MGVWIYKTITENSLALSHQVELPLTLRSRKIHSWIYMQKAPQKTLVHLEQEIWARTFTAIQSWKQARCLLPTEQMSKPVPMQREYRTAVKVNDLRQHATRMHLSNTQLSEKAAKD